jgi:formylmethanofuran dehydrogenase subunit D
MQTLKKIFRSGTIFLFVLVAPVSLCQAQTKKLIHYWHFNNTVPLDSLRKISADYSTLGNASVIYEPKPGAGSDTTKAYMDNLAGDTINQRPGYGGCCGLPNYGVRTRNPSDNMQFLWYLPTKAYQNIVIKYETQSSSTGSGQHRQNFSYSVDSAVTFTTAGLPIAWDSAGLVWGKVTLNLSTLTNVNNNGKFAFRILFSPPNTGTSGNNRFDNITVEGDTMIAPAITSNPLTTGIIGKPYSYSITATGSPAPALSVSGNPGWLTLNGNILSGNPPSTGTVGPITITAANPIGTTQQQFSLMIADSINPVAPSIISVAPTTIHVDSLYSYAISATGVPRPALSVSGNPSWLVLNDTVLSGTPPVNGLFGPIHITAANIVSTDTQSFSITVTSSPVITSDAPTAGVVNVPYSYSIVAPGTPEPVISVSGNPSWLTLNGNILSGLPVSTGIIGPVTITASNSEGTVQQIFSIIVASVPVITSTAITSGTAGLEYSYTINATGTPSPSFTVSGNPSWLDFDGSTLSGIPTSSGFIGPITIVAANVASSDTQSFYLHIANPAVNTNASKLLYYWHFNNTMPADGSGGINFTSNIIKADYSFSGNGSLLYLPWPGVKDPGVMDNLVGDTINQRNGFGGCCSFVNNAVRARNPSDSMDLLLYLPTTKYRNIVIKYETQLSSVKSGQHEQIFSYSIDSASTFITTDLPVVSNFADTVWSLVTLDLRSITAVNNNSKFVFKMNFSAPNTSNKGNNRFDNITVEGDSILDAVNMIDYQADDYILFPNPASANLNLTGTFEGEKSISIYNSTGMLVNTITVSGREAVIDVADLNPGFYFLKIVEKGRKGIITIKFVRQ